MQTLLRKSASHLKSTVDCFETKAPHSLSISPGATPRLRIWQMEKSVLQTADLTVPLLTKIKNASQLQAIFFGQATAERTRKDCFIESLMASLWRIEIM